MVGEGDVPQGAGGVEAGPKPVDPVAGKTVAEILGEIVWLMTQDTTGREMKVAEIEALVMPAILAKRFHIKYAQAPTLVGSRAPHYQPVSVDIFEPKPPLQREICSPAVMVRFSMQLSPK